MRTTLGRRRVAPRAWCGVKVADAVPEFRRRLWVRGVQPDAARGAAGNLETDHNVVASAPTASGKTALAELAICKTLSESGTALFIAPLRALTNEGERARERFEDLGYSVYVVSGERDLNPAVPSARTCS